MKTIRMSVLTAAVLGTIALAPPAEAITIADPAFQVFEICDSNCGSFGESGHFRLQNNTTTHVITGFAVGNSDAQFASTARPSWAAGVDSSDSFGFGEDAFFYVGSANFLGFGSDDNFFWSTATLATSPFQ